MKKQPEAKTIRVSLKSYDHKILDLSLRKICSVIQKTGSIIRGPIPMPKKTYRVTLLRSPHIDKKALDQYEQCTYKRVFDILEPTDQTLDSLAKLEIAAGIEVKITIR